MKTPLRASGRHLPGLTILAVASLSAMPASAADPGGSCCADLEERLADLEAASAWKGTRRVTLEVFGQINTAIVVWDDGRDRDAYVVDNDFNSSRAGFRGSAKIGGGWKAAFLLEMETNHAASDAVDQTNAYGPPASFDLRYAHWVVENEAFGKATIGHTSSATDNLYKFGNVSGSFGDSELHYNGRYFVRSITAGGTSTTLRWDTIANNLDTPRGEFVRYDTPSLGGLVVSAAWGEDDVWDVTLRFSRDLSGFKIAAGLGYVEDKLGEANVFGDESEDLIASAGLMHLASGLYVHIGAGQRQTDARPGFDDTAQYGYVQAGIERNFTGLGPTTLFADYGAYSDWGAGARFDRDVAAPGGVSSNNSFLVDSAVRRFGFGATQKFDKAALEMYAIFNWYEADLTASGTPTGTAFHLPSEDWFSATLGSRLKF